MYQKVEAGHECIFALEDLKQGMNQGAIAIADSTPANTQIWSIIRWANPPRKWEEHLTKTE